MHLAIFHYLGGIHIKLKDQRLFSKESSELMMDDDDTISPRPSELGLRQVVWLLKEGYYNK